MPTLQLQVKTPCKRKSLKLESTKTSAMKFPKNTFAVFTVFVLSIFFISSCTKTNINNEDVNATLGGNVKREAIMITTPTVNVRYLGHRGAGSNNYNAVNMENSIPSILEALKVMDGVEVDLQMSRSGTIWLFHDADINRTLCKPGAPRSILNMYDNEIAKLELCSRTKSGRVYKLAELVSLWNSRAPFYIAMHVKDDFTPAFYNSIGGRSNYLRKFADALAKEIELSSLKHSADRFLVEQEDLVLPDALRKYPVGKQVKYYIFNYKSFNSMVADALTLGYDGVSCNFTDRTLSATNIKSAHEKGLSVMVWTPYSDKEVQKVYNMKPDFIQTDQTNVKKDLKL